jgi:hypothetical protein
MDGHELARRLRAAEADRGAVRTPIVAVTANAMRGEEERCLASGMDAYLLRVGGFVVASDDCFAMHSEQLAARLSAMRFPPSINLAISPSPVA